MCRRARDPPSAIPVAAAVPSRPRPRPAGQRAGCREGRPSPRRKLTAAGGEQCKDGLTGKGVVLPPDAAAEVIRREAGRWPAKFPGPDAVERELVRQMALGARRGRRCSAFHRSLEHDARMNPARFANWELDEQLAAVELGNRLGEDPELTVSPAPPQLRRLRLADRPLDAPGQRPYDRRRRAGPLHVDRCRPGLAWTCWAGRRGFATWILADEAAGAALCRPGRARRRAWPDCGRSSRRRSPGWDARCEEAWEGDEELRLQIWRSGLEMDLGPEGTRLRRYDGGRSAVPLGLDQAGAAAEGARRAVDLPARCRAGREPQPRGPSHPPAGSESPRPRPRLRSDRGAPPRSRSRPAGEPPVLDFWIGGPSQPTGPGNIHSRDKTNPTPSQPAR